MGSAILTSVWGTGRPSVSVLSVNESSRRTWDTKGEHSVVP